MISADIRLALDALKEDLDTFLTRLQDLCSERAKALAMRKKIRTGHVHWANYGAEKVR